MTYSQTIDYLFSMLPMFSRSGASALKKDLTNTLLLCRHLGEPQSAFRSIHVAGTNGKGSVSHMLAAVLQKAGYKTGLYTSPHLRDFRERIRIDGEMISQDEVVAFTENMRLKIEEIRPSFFELTVAMAFDHFARHQVDIAVIEVGLGGRLDSTNIITPELSVITNIGMDHMNILGDTLPQIAAEKAGIIKEHVPVVIGETHTQTRDVFIQKATSCKAALSFADECLSVIPEGFTDNGLLRVQLSGDTSLPAQIQLDLTGTYQLKNVVTVLTSVSVLRRKGFAITNEMIKDALSQVKLLTGLKGRWHKLSDNPLTICDTGHNTHGIEEVLKSIAGVKYNTLHFVLGMVRDKDISKVLQMLPVTARYYFTMPAIERAKPCDELAAEAAAAGLEGQSFPSVVRALKAAQSAAVEGDLVFVGGSTFVVAEVI